MQGRNVPLAGIALAVMTGAVLIAAGTDVLLILAAVLVWIASLWLAAPAPAAAAAREGEKLGLTASAMHDLLEHSGLATLILDGNRIVVANTAAREALGSHIVDQDARVAIRHPAAIDVLNRPSGGSATVQGLTGPRASWHISRHPVDERFSLIELVDRTAEVDISRAYTDFVANASHELRTPLASIIGYVETLVDGGSAIRPEQAARFHATVLHEAHRLQRLVADLMALSQVEAEKHDQPSEAIDLVALVRRAANDSAGSQRRERLRFLGQSAPLVVRGDTRQLEQLVRNVVGNALEYGQAGSAVDMEVENDGRGMALLRVRDRGEGIPAEHLPHLTRRFYRVDAGRSRAAGGTGLGLAIVKHIVERHRGRLDIASRSGQGTTVTVRLPLAD